MGLTPITFGDVVVDESLRFSIVSGDQIMLELARVFKPEKVIFVANMDGIFSTWPPEPNERPLEIVDEDTAAHLSKEETGVDDVTGGIHGKLKIMFDISSFNFETIVLNGARQNRLKEALLGKDIICTKVLKRQK
jgi:isopentenyl phosphate kinase